MRLVFDIETPMYQNGDPEFNKKSFVKNCKSLACICAEDIDSGQKWTFHDDENVPRDGTNKQGIGLLMRADLLVAHNGRGFDIPALCYLYPTAKVRLEKAQLFDSCAASRQLFSWNELKKYDKENGITHSEYATKAIHSLEAWGDRLNKFLEGDIQKGGDFKKNVDWSRLEINQDLLEYCMQDVAVNVKLFHVLMEEHNKEK